MQNLLYLCSVAQYLPKGEKQTMKKHVTILFTGLAVLLVLLIWLDLCCGTIWISPLRQLSELWDTIADRKIGNGLSDIEQRILLGIRLPKALTALLAGMALSVSGLMMQTLFRNALAGPYTLGVSSGASLGVAFITLCATIAGGNISGWQFSTVTAAIIGSTIILLIVMGIAKRVRSNVSLLIIGMMFGSIAGALVNLMQNFANPDALKLFIVWTLGSLQSVGWADMPILTEVIAVGMIPAICAIKPMNGLLLGEDYARGLGIHIPRTRMLIVVATGLLAGGVTAFCGPIAFVGVAVPHIARSLFRTSNHRITMPAAGVIGADILIACDILCSLNTYPLPISTMSALFGAPIIIWIILRGEKKN